MGHGGSIILVDNIQNILKHGCGVIGIINKQ